MSVKDTTKVKIISDGKEYEIENPKYDNLEKLIVYAKSNMKSPTMIHFISHIADAEKFRKTKGDLIRLYQRALKRQFKKANVTTQQCPDTLLAYSIEFKYTTQKHIDGKEDAYRRGNTTWKKTEEELPFLHLHCYVIADCNKTHPRSFLKASVEALNELKGLRASRYIPRKQKDVSDKKQYYHNLNRELDDGFNRILYIGKTEQKCPEIPYRKKFGMSEVN